MNQDSKRKEKIIDEIKKGIPDKKREKLLSKYIGYLFGEISENLWEEVCWKELQNTNKAYCQSPLDEDELRRIFDTVANHERKNKKENNQVMIFEENFKKDKNVCCFRDQFEEVYVRVEVGNHYEVIKCDSERFESWVIINYLESTGADIKVKDLKQFIRNLKAFATFGKNKEELSLRIASHDNNIWYDLGDDDCRAICVSKKGWQVIEKPPIIFKKGASCEQVIPQKNGDVKELLKYINIKDDKQKILFLVSTIANFIPEIIRPAHVYYGSKGSAKSTVSKNVKSLTDPAEIELLPLVSNQTELSQQLNQNYLLVFDNLSEIKKKTSDILCRAITEGGFTKRKLYTDDESIQFKFKRAIILTGVNLVVTRPDLLDRSLLFQLERLDESEMKSEKEFLAAFEKEKPNILGGVFDVLSKAMKIHPSIKLDKIPRMADFTIWGCAIAEALGYGKEAFLDAYEDNRKIQNTLAIEENAVASSILMFMEGQSSWSGTSKKLMSVLKSVAKKEELDMKTFPKSPSALSRKINDIKSNLLNEGIEIEKISQRDWQIKKS